jgi:hypothetical protein
VCDDVADSSGTDDDDLTQMRSLLDRA